MPTPTTQDFVNAANISYEPTAQLPSGWSRLIPDSEDDNTGFYGTAFRTSSDQVIVAFRGTDLPTITTDPKFAVAQVIADLQIFQGQVPASYTTALNYTQGAQAAAIAAGVSADNVFIDGHSLGAAQAEYVAAQTNLAGATFGGPGIAQSTIPNGNTSRLNNIVEYGDPIGNYSADSNYDGYLLQSDQIARYGGAQYIGSFFDRLEIQAAGEAVNPKNSDDVQAGGYALFAVAIAEHHLLTDYASTLGMSLPSGMDALSGTDILAAVNDILHGGVPISGGTGNDVLLGSGADEALRGGLGADTLVAGDGSDQLYGNDGADVLLGNMGDDVVVSGADDDTAFGGFGDDVMLGNQGNDLLLGNQNNDTLFGGQGGDTVVGGRDNDVALGNEGNDVLLGNEGKDVLLGNQGNDIVFGGQGDDTIYGGQGDDTIYGNEGKDLLFGNEGANTFVFRSGDTDFMAGSRPGDTIADFKSGIDVIDFAQGPSPSAQDFGSATSSSSDFSAIQDLAGGLIRGGDTYAFVTDGSNGYLFTGENGTIHDAIEFLGANRQTSVQAGDLRSIA